ncbi:MAG: fatty acyl-AMP ligase [Tumebacillaceae bacterium]
MSVASESQVRGTTLVELVQWWAERKPNETVYTFLTDGENEEVRITFAELDREARRIAARLQALNAANERALLLYAPSLEYILAYFGCLYAGVIAVPVYPPHPKKSASRVHSIIDDSSAKFAMTSAKQFQDLQTRFGREEQLARLSWLVTDAMEDDEETEWQDPQVTADSIAFLQYTSGSTSTPKGVMVTHGNLMNNVYCIEHNFGVKEPSNYVIWLPPFHDMGLIGGILSSMYQGSSTTLMAPFDFLQKPLRWLQAISKYKAVVSGGPNFAYDLCVRKITPEQRDALDLSTLKIAFNGAEPVRHTTLERFAEYFEPAGYSRNAMYPCYGLAEGTLMITGAYRDQGPKAAVFDAKSLAQNEVREATADSVDTRHLVSSGRVTPGHELVIVSPDTLQEVPAGHVGEIWVSGPSIAIGYWNRPEQTAETFHATLPDREGKRFLRTGDLGFMHEGELFVTGRVKDVIIIRGRNYYPQDIELTVENLAEQVREGCTAAFSIDADGEERVVVVAELDRAFRPRKTDDPAEVERLLTEIRTTIRKGIVEQHEIPVHDVVLLKINTIPKTSSGKIQRSACRNMYLNRTLEVWGE